jgi:hypothetical protein
VHPPGVGGERVTIFSEGKSQGRDSSRKRAEEGHKTCGLWIIREISVEGGEGLRFIFAHKKHGPGRRDIRLGRVRWVKRGKIKRDGTFTDGLGKSRSVVGQIEQAQICEYGRIRHEDRKGRHVG